MLGAILWDTGPLGDVAAFNLIEDAREEGALAGSLVGAAAAVEAGMHEPEILTGNLLEGFLGDLYHRFHVAPRAIALGNVVTQQVQPVVVWNAYRRAHILTSIGLDNAEGIDVSGTPSPPVQFAPGQERAYDVEIAADGPAVIAATITLNFSNGESMEIEVGGTRIVIWNWQPNWAAGMIERLQWYTDVMQAARGEEQRRALRLDPRQYLEFSCAATGIDRRLMESALYNWGARTWAVPLWFDGQDLAATLPSGSTEIPLNPAGRSYRAGDLVLLTNGDPETGEAVEIDSVGATITLARATQLTWPVGTRVYPARAAVIENLATVSRFTGQASDLRLQWRMTKPMSWTAEATPTYRGLPVLEQKPNWTEDPTLGFERKLSILDAGTGRVEVTDETGLPLGAQHMRYTLPSRAAIDAWKKRLWALRGKQGPIWVPTWADDLTIVATIGDSSTSIDVAWAGYVKYISQDPNRRDIRIELHDGTIFYRRIQSSMEVSSTVERLTINTALGQTVQPEEVALVSFMAQSRSDSDQHELAYFTGEAADTTFTARAYRGVA